MSFQINLQFTFFQSIIWTLAEYFIILCYQYIFDQLCWKKERHGVFFLDLLWKQA